jgi:hypothetical protein
VKTNLDRVVSAAVFVVLFSWLLYSMFWVFHAFSYWWVIPYMHDVFTKPSYLSFSGGIILRTVAALLAILAAGSFLSKGWSPRVAKLVMAAVILESIYFISYFPAAGVGPQTGDWVTTVEATFSTIMAVFLVPVPLFMLASRMRKDPNSFAEFLKWASIAGVAYIFVFWIKYTSNWLATFIATGADYLFYDPGAGLNYVLKYPSNMLMFLLTVVGLFLLALILLWIVLPLIRKTPGAKPNLRGIGLVLTLLGGYFITIIAMNAVLGPVGGISLFTDYFHNLNVDRWMVILPVLGVPLMLTPKNRE